MEEITAHKRLVDLRNAVIKPASVESRDKVLEQLLDVAGRDSGTGTFLDSGQPASETILAALTHCEYLRDIAVSDPDLILEVAEAEPVELVSRRLAEARECWRGEAITESALMVTLRKAKKAFSFAVALFDLAHTMETRQIVAWWSRFAEASIAAATNYLLLAAEI